MSYPDDYKVTEFGTTSSTSTTAVWPSHVSGDLLVAVYGMANSADDHSTPAGLTKIVSNGSSFGTLSSFYLSATSSSETNPTSTHTNDAFRWTQTFVIKDAPTTSPIDTAAAGASNNGSGEVCTSQSGTTTVSNVLLLNIAYTDQWGHLTPEPGVMTLFENAIRSNALAISACWDFQESSGAVTQFDWFIPQGTNDSHVMLIPIKSLAAVIPPRVTGTPSVQMFTGTFPAGGKSGWSANNVSTDVATIDGITTNDYTVSQQSQGSLLNPSHENCTIVTSANGQISLAGMDFDDDGPFDITNNKVAFHFATVGGGNQVLTASVEDHGFVVGLKSGTNEYAIFDGGGSDTNIRAPQCIVIDANSTIMHEENTFDITDVNGCTFGNHRTTNTNVSAAGTIHSLNSIDIIGGVVSLPAKWSTVYDAAVSASLATIDVLGSGYQTKQDIQIGDGSATLYFDTSGQSMSVAPASSVAAKNVEFQAAKVTITFLAVSGDTVKIKDPIVSVSQADDLIIDPSSTSSATWDTDGGTINGFNFSSAVDIGALIGLTIINCGSLVDDSLDLSGGNCLISSTHDTNAISISGATEAAIQTTLDQYKNTTISNNPVGIRINSTFAGNIALDFTTIDFGGNTADIHYSSTQAASILTSTVDSALTYTFEDDESVNEIAPVLALTLNSDTASTLIRYFEDDSQTIVDSVTGTTLVYTFPDLDPIDIEFLKQSYVPVNIQDRVPFEGSIDIVMDFDEAYNSGHGLTITTEFDYVRATKVLTINSDQAALDVRSALADVIRTNASYNNTPLTMVAIPGLTRIDLVDGTTITSMSTWKGAGSEVFDAADSSNPTEKWFAIKSGGDITGGTVQYRQTDSGNSTSLTLTNNVVDEAFQHWSDPNHDGSAADGFDFSDYMLIKSFLAGSKQARVDVLVSTGLSALQSNFYSVVLANEDHPYSGSDPGVTGTITLIAGGTEGGEVFAYEWVDGGTTSGVDIADQINYNGSTIPNSVIAGGTGLRWFELGDMVIHNATSVETQKGFEEGTTPTIVGFYCSRAGADHPDFTRFEADNGNFYVPAVTASITVTGMPTAGSEIRLQIYNDTAKTADLWAISVAHVLGDKVLRTTGVGSEQTAGLYMVCTTAGTSDGSTEPTWDTTVGNTTAEVSGTLIWTTFAILYFDDDPGASGYSDTYINLEEFSAGDTFRTRFAEMDGAISYSIFETTGIVSSSGFAFTVIVIPNPVYALNARDGSGSAITNTFTANYTLNRIVLDTNTDFAVIDAFAFFAFETTSSQGMNQFWLGVIAIDTGNYRNDVSKVDIKFDESAGFVKQTDNARWFRTDGLRPAVDPTTGLSGLEINWRNPVSVFDGGGGGFTSNDRLTIEAGATQVSVNTIDTTIGTPTDTDIATDIANLNDFDPVNDAVANVTLVATTTTNTDMRGTNNALLASGTPSNFSSLSITSSGVVKSDPLYNGAIHIDSINGVNGTTVDTNGTERKPVRNISDALNLANSLKIDTIKIAPNSTISLSGGVTNRLMLGSNWTLVMNSQDLSGSTVQGAFVSGTVNNFALVVFLSCRLTNMTCGPVQASEGCYISGTFKANSSGPYGFDKIRTVEGSDAKFNFNSQVDCDATFRQASVDLKLINLGSSTGQSARITGDGSLTLPSNCTGGDLFYDGNFRITDNSVTTTITQSSHDQSFDDIQGATFNTSTDSLEAISDAVGGVTGAIPTAAENADKLLGRNIAGGSDGGRTVTEAHRANRNRVNLVTGDVYEEDDTTVSHSYDVTRAELDAVSEVDPT